jgi:RNA 3'-terminal phosphate cyclase (ATP)
LVEFWPGDVQPGEYRFDIGTAGSTTLVLQTVLPPMMLAAAPSQLTILGGTHNPMAPSAGFLQTAFAPLLAKFGPRLDITADPFGFYPAGGGQLAVQIEPASTLRPITLSERGPIVRRTATAYLAQLPDHIAARELDLVARRLGWHAKNSDLRTVVLTNTRSPGNALEVTLVAEHAIETCFVCGERGKKAEHVAQQAVEEIKRYEQANVPIGEHLADQLLIPLALAGSGSFVTLPLSLHSMTNMSVIEQFLPVRFATRELDAGGWQVSVERR